jgi:hypothetical protein
MSLNELGRGDSHFQQSNQPSLVSGVALSVGDGLKISEEAGLPMVFCQPRLTQNKILRVFLDRIILEVNVWALIITIILTLVFERYLFPKGTLG